VFDFHAEVCRKQVETKQRFKSKLNSGKRNFRDLEDVTKVNLYGIFQLGFIVGFKAVESYQSNKQNEQHWKRKKQAMPSVQKKRRAESSSFFADKDFMNICKNKK